MDAVIKLGRYVYAATIAGFGVQHVIGATTIGRDLGPGPIWIAGSAPSATIFGGILIVIGLGIAAGRRPFFPAAALGAMLLVYDAVFYLPGVVAHVREPSNWTRGSELLAMCGMAFVIAGGASETERFRWPLWKARLIDFGLVLCGAGVFVWAAQHFIYAQFTATLIPTWAPWRLAGAIAVGLAFLTVSLAFVFRLQPRVAATVLAAVFLAIVLVVHVQRVTSNPSSGREWTSAFIALSMLGGSLAIADACRTNP